MTLGARERQFEGQEFTVVGGVCPQVFGAVCTRVGVVVRHKRRDGKEEGVAGVAWG